MSDMLPPGIRCWGSPGWKTRHGRFQSSTVGEARSPGPAAWGHGLHAWGLKAMLTLTQPVTGFGLCVCVCVWIFGASLETRTVPASPNENMPQLWSCCSLL